MSTIGTLVFELGIDTSSFDKGLQNAEKESKGFAGNTGNFLTNALSFATGGAVLNGLGFVADKIKGVASSMIDSNAEFETYQTQFGVLLKSSTEAKKRLEELAKFGATTPFELPELVRADKVLTAFGLDSADTAKRFGVSGAQIRTTIGDVAAGTGTSFEDLSNTFGKFASGATGDAIARFQELGIATKEEMANWGLEFSKSGQLLTPTAEAFTVLEKHVRDKFGGMMDAQSKTFSGMVSNLQDWAGQTLRTLGAPIFEVVKDKLQIVLDFLSKPETQAAITNFAKLLADGIGSAMDWLSNTAIPALVSGWNTISPALITVGDLISRVSDGFKEGGLAGAIKAILPQMKQFGSDLKVQLGEWAQQFMDWIPGATVKLITGAGELLGTFLRYLYDHGPEILQTLGEWELQFGKWAITKGLPALGRALLSIGAGLWDYIKEKWSQAFAADSIGGSIVESIKQGIISKWDAFKGWFLSILAASIPGGAAAMSALGVTAPGRAIGGPVNAGQSYTVGERGQELFVPAVRGNIVPNGATNGGGNVYVTVQGSVTADRDLAQTIRQELLKFKRANPTAGLT